MAAPTWVLRKRELARLAKERNLSDSDIARLGGLHITHYRRVLKGDVAVGDRFMASLAQVFGEQATPVLFKLKKNGTTR